MFISALELSNFMSNLFILRTGNILITSRPQRLLFLHLTGEYVTIFPLGFLGFRIRQLHKLYSLSGSYFVVYLLSSVLFELCNVLYKQTAFNSHATVRATHPSL